MKLSILLNLFILFSFNAFPQGEKLRLNLPTGLKFSTQTDSHTEMKQTVFGIEQEIGIDMQIITQARVTDFENGIYQLEYFYQSLRMETLSALYNSLVDTDEGTNEESMLMRVIIGKPFKVTLSETGNVQSVRGLDSIIENSANNTDLDSIAILDFKSSLLGTFGEEAFQQNLREIFVPFSEESVSEGDIWTDSYETSASNMPFSVFNIVSLKDLNPKHLLLQVTGSVKSRASEAINMNGYTGTMNLTGESLSEVLLFPKLLLCNKSTLTRELKGSINFKPDPDADQIVDVPTRIILKNNTTISLEN